MSYTKRRTRHSLTVEEKAAFILDVADHLYRDMDARELATKHRVNIYLPVMYASRLRAEGIAVPMGRGFRRLPKNDAWNLALSVLRDRKHGGVSTTALTGVPPVLTETKQRIIHPRQVS